MRKHHANYTGLGAHPAPKWPGESEVYSTDGGGAVTHYIVTARYKGYEPHNDQQIQAVAAAQGAQPLEAEYGTRFDRSDATFLVVGAGAANQLVAAFRKLPGVSATRRKAKRSRYGGFYGLGGVGGPDRPEYEYYAVDRGEILSGWATKAEAEKDAIGWGARVMSRWELLNLRIDPQNDANWAGATAGQVAIGPTSPEVDADIESFMQAEDARRRQLNGLGGVNQPRLGAYPAYPRETEIIAITYGQVPLPEQFFRRFQRIVGRGPYTMELVGEDEDAMEEAYGMGQAHFRRDGTPVSAYSFDQETLYMVVQSLTEEWETNGNEAAGSLASGILTTLGFEWV